MGGVSLTVWPYTTSDFANPSDPLNLIFPNADPRAIRQEMTVHANPSGNYDRACLVGGTLQVTPMAPTSPTSFVPTGDPVEAFIFEAHRGTLSDSRGQVTERVAQVLLGEPKQSLSWTFVAGHTDHFVRQVLCGTE